MRLEITEFCFELWFQFFVLKAALVAAVRSNNQVCFVLHFGHYPLGGSVTVSFTTLMVKQQYEWQDAENLLKKIAALSLSHAWITRRRM